MIQSTDYKKVMYGPIHVVGIALRTTNDDKKSYQEIPLLWKRFYQEGVPQKIHSKIGGDIYAVYTDFENEGKNNHGLYTLVIGCAVAESSAIPDGMTRVSIPRSTYALFPSQKGNPKGIVDTWEKIYALTASNTSFDQKKTYHTEFERYQPEGSIDVFIGLKE